MNAAPRPVYLDNNATTRADEQVVAAMLPYFREQFGNPSSTHTFGSGVAEAVRAARRQVQALLGAAFDHEIVFTSGGTESDNAAIHAALAAAPERNEIVTTAVEHSAILQPVGLLEKAGTIRVHRIGVDAGGRLDLDAYRRALSPRTALVSVMWANNETGTIFPVAELAAMAREAGALFHTDGVQAAGKIPMDVKATPIDMLSLSAHKLHGPKGIGALYVRKGVKLRALVVGGQQERGRRGGTENVPGIVGLGRAAELALAHLDTERTRVAALRDRLEAGLLALGDCRVNGDARNRLPNTCNLAFDYIDGEALLTNLNRAGIAASSGSACSSGSTEPSHVLRAMNVPPSALLGALRLSLSRETEAADIDRMLDVMPGILARLRETSPHWRDRAQPAAAAE